MAVKDRVKIESESSLDEKETDSENQLDDAEGSTIEQNENSDDENIINDEHNKSSGSSDSESNDDLIDQSKGGKSMNLGWADSIQKILKCKKKKSKKTLVLSKAKKLTDKRKDESVPALSFEIEGQVKSGKSEPDKLPTIKKDSDEPPKKKIKTLWTERIKPNILDKDREKTLSKVATKGVVQLFNAVRMQQKDIDKKLEEAGPLERKRSKVLKSIDKRSFLDVLMGDKSQEVDNPIKKDEDLEPTEIKTEDETERTKSPTWNVLREDFMMGGKLKDWDKNVSDGEESSTEEIQLSNSD